MSWFTRSSLSRSIVLTTMFAVLGALVVAAPRCSIAAEPEKTPAKGPAKAGEKYDWKKLFDGKTLKGWKTPQFGGEGKVAVKEGAIVIERGDTMSGIACTDKVPKVDYELTLEGKRIDGSDFFCTTTFPVDESFASLVVGGWGGTVVGISSIDDYDASDNATNKIRDFKQKQWYRLRLRVTKAKLEAWIDSEKMVDFVREGHKLSTRWECDACKPLGIATYCTVGAVRDIRIRSLKPEEIKAIADEAAAAQKDDK